MKDERQSTTESVFQLSPEQIAKQFQTDLKRGLSSQEDEKRLKTEGLNELVDNKESKSKF